MKKNNYTQSSGQIERLMSLLTKGNIYTFSYAQQQYILNNNLNASYLLTFDDWKDKGASIYKGTKALHLPYASALFDVGQTTYRMKHDEDFLRLRLNNDLSDNDKAMISSMIAHVTNGDVNTAELYSPLISELVNRRFNRYHDYMDADEISEINDIEPSVLSDLSYNVFEYIKEVYDELSRSNDFVDLHQLIVYALDNKQKGESYGFINNQDSTNELSYSEQAMDLSDNEIQQDFREPSINDRGAIQSENGRTVRPDEGRVQNQGWKETDGTEPHGQSVSSTDSISSSSGNSTAGNSVPVIEQTSLFTETGVFDTEIFSRADEVAERVDTVIANNIESVNKADYVVSVLNNYLEKTDPEIGDNLFGYDPDEPDVLMYQQGDDIETSTYSMSEAYEMLTKTEMSDELLEQFWSVSEDTSTYVIGTEYIDNLQKGITNVPIQNKTFDELNEVERGALEYDNSLYLKVYNNSVDKSYEPTPNDWEFLNSHPYGTNDGIKDSGQIKVWAHFFNPAGNQDWIATEFDYNEDGHLVVYGCVKLFDDIGWEWGSFDLTELKDVHLGAEFGFLRIERDKGVNVGDSLYSVIKRVDTKALNDLNLDEPVQTSWIDTLIRNNLLSGTGFKHGKYRLYELYKYPDHEYTKEERIALLKQEYGVGGESDGTFSISWDSKGIVYQIKGEDHKEIEVKTLSWSEVDTRLSKLIDDGAYMADDAFRDYMKDMPWNHLIPERLHKNDYGATVNGTLREFEPDNLLQKVIERGEAINTVREHYEYTYHITISHTDLIGVTDENTEYDVDIVRENETTHVQERITSYDEWTRLKANDVVEKLKNWKRSEMDDYYNNRNEQTTAEPVIEQTQVIDVEPIKIDMSEVVKNNLTDTNYHIKNNDIGVGSPRERFANNIKAIKLLKQLDDGNVEYTTDEEKDILANYVGWGGLQDAFDESKWPDEYKQLKALLTDEEYSSALSSVNTAFYTQPSVINAVYKALDKFGFEKGNILEPSCGVGNFFGSLPEKMAKSNLYGIELDSLSARIAKRLYPKANIQNMGFENADFEDNFFDVAVGNVPFGDFGVLDSRYNKYNFKIHDYFFAKTIDKVRPNGVIALITSKGTMDKLNSKAREYIAERCDLIGAVRLPNDAFKSAAGTEVCSDIIFLSKRESPRVNMPEWVHSSNDNFFYSDYFYQYMSMDELSERVYQMATADDLNPYIDLLETYKGPYGINQIPRMLPVSKFDMYRQNMTRYSDYVSIGDVREKWHSKWHPRWGEVKASTDYSFGYYDFAYGLYELYVQDPEYVINEVASSNKFSKLQTWEEKYEAAKDYLENQHSIVTEFKQQFVDPVVQEMTSELKRDSDSMQAINTYFADHKEMIAGKQRIASARFGYDVYVDSDPNKSLSDVLDNCVDNLSYNYEPLAVEVSNKKTVSNDVIVPADTRVANYSYGMIDDKIYYRINSTMKLIPSDSTNYDMISDLIELRTAYRDIVKAQLNNVSDEELSVKQITLKETYDNFVSTHGTIYSNRKKINPLSSNDASLFILQALENVDEDAKKVVGLSDIFTQRTIHNQEVVIDHYDDVHDALLASLRNRVKVDIDYICHLTDKSQEDVINELHGAIYHDHASDEYLSADEYLSGNVRIKLREVNDELGKAHTLLRSGEGNAEELRSKIQWLEENRNALADSLPTPLAPYEIDMPLGATWIPVDVIQDFIDEVISPDSSYWNKPKVSYSELSGKWGIENKTRQWDTALLTVEYGLSVKGHNALDLLESCLNLQSDEVFVNIEDPTSKNGYRRVVDKEKTILAKKKQEKIKQAFTDYVNSHEHVLKELTSIYNEKYNSIVERKYDPNLINPVGMVNMIDGHEIYLYDHQKEAIAKALYGGNTGVFHTVGAGKTLTLACIAMESKRLGLSNKSLFVVPKSIVNQWGKSFLQAYPNANILVADEKSFKKENRRRFIGKIATGNYDAIIISEEQFKLLKLSDERVSDYINEDIERLVNYIAENRYTNSRKWSVKQAEQTKKRLETKVKKRQEMKKDDFINFEDLGIDKLFIDESHHFKNLSFESGLGRVKGIGASADAEKSNDLYYKTRYLNELTNNKGIVFATGTPISNYLAEMYTVMRYLQPDTLKQMGVDSFDSWVSVFGEIVEDEQLDVTGTKYRSVATLKRYHNLPELMKMFKQFADIRTKDDISLPNVPDYQKVNVEVPRLNIQADYLDELNERVDNCRINKVDPTEDNMLKITNDGRLMALDPRLVGLELDEGDRTKSDYIADNVYKEYVDSYAIKGTQAVFSDLGVPNSDGRFSIYTDIKNKLIEKGIPENEIAFIHDCKNDKEKQVLFDKVNEGQVRVIFGSTSKLGTGVNIQRRMVALHHCDVPWKPSDIEQREGRIVRQQNINKDTRIYRYVTADTFDAYSWQIIENKSTFISQVMTSKNPARSCEDLADENGTILDAAEIKALATGNPLIKERMTLENEIKVLSIERAEHLKSLELLKEKIKTGIPNKLKYLNERLSNLIEDNNAYTKPSVYLDSKNNEMYELDITVNGTRYTDYEEAGNALKEMAKRVHFGVEMFDLTHRGIEIGSYQGYKIYVASGTNFGEIKYGIGNKNLLIINKYESPKTLVDKLIRQLDTLPEQINSTKANIEATTKDLADSKLLVDKPYDREDELKAKKERLDAILEIMNSNAEFSATNEFSDSQIIAEPSDDLSDDYDEEEYANVKEL